MTFEDVLQIFTCLACACPTSGFIAEANSVRFQIFDRDPRGECGVHHGTFLGDALGRNEGALYSPEERLCAGLLYQALAHQIPDRHRNGAAYQAVLASMVERCQEPGWVDALVACAVAGEEPFRAFVEQQTGVKWP